MHGLAMLLVDWMFLERRGTRVSGLVRLGVLCRGRCLCQIPGGFIVKRNEVSYCWLRNGSRLILLDHVSEDPKEIMLIP